MWAALSSLWSPGAAAPVLEAERGILYVTAAAAALLLLSSREASAALLGGIVAGAVLVSLYALGTRLFPGHVGGAYDPSSGYQLAEPIGYWNALGLLTALAILLAVGFAAHATHIATRALAAVALVALLPTLYFSFSRGALVALAGGAVVQAALDPRRARLFVSGARGERAGRARRAGSVPVACPHRGGRDAADRTGRGQPSHSAARRARGRCRGAMLVLHLLERRLRPPRGRDVAGRSHRGDSRGGVSPARSSRPEGRSRWSTGLPILHRAAPGRGGRSSAPPLSASGNGRGDYWHVAWEMARDEPLLGTGAGSFEAHWLRERPISFHARDAHNLYLETLAELGPLGLALLLATLALPLPPCRRHAGALRTGCGRGLRRVSAPRLGRLALGGPGRHAPALFCACALLSARACERGVAHGKPPHRGPGADRPGARRRPRHARRQPCDGGEHHCDRRRDPDRALADARRAIDWAPWSHEPWQLRGEAELLLEDDAAARRSLKRALELDPESWSTWFDLAVASRGAERARALAEAKRLNPLSPEIAEFQTES